MLRVTATLAVFLISAIALAAQAQATNAEAELHAISQELLDAIAPGHAEVWRKYLHDRVIHVDETGTIRDKDALLKELTPLPRGLTGSTKIDRFKSEVHGNTAVVAYETQEHLDYYGQILRSRFRVSDTWLQTPEGWRLISEQISAVLKDPPAIQLTEEQLCAYNGSYALTESIVLSISCATDGLKAERVGRPTTTYLPEAPDVFFAVGQPRVRRIFQRDATGKIVGFVDRREGEDVRWTKR